MIQAEKHKDANKRKTDTTRQTGTCAKTGERMYNCVMCYTTILLRNWREQWLQKDAECTMSANWCDQRLYSITTWSHLPRIHDTWKWHARSTGLFGQGPLLEKYIIPQLVPRHSLSFFGTNHSQVSLPCSQMAKFKWVCLEMTATN